MILDGKLYAAELKNVLTKQCAALKETHGRAPSLHVLLIGSNPGSLVYVSMKQKRAQEFGIQSTVHRLDETIDKKTVLDILHDLNKNPEVDGILVQLPLPPHLNANEIIDTISPEKDVDGLTSINLGRLLRGTPSLVSCTPLGCMHILKQWRQDISGLNAVIVGRSTLVGKPLSLLLTHANATVTLCHSKTKNLEMHTKQADILIAACGSPKLIRKEHVKPGACIIDVGMNRLTDGSLSGDVAFDEIVHIADAITPVPFGVGPMTIAYLMANTIQAMKSTHINLDLILQKI
ncbi:MAG: bifunctional methylenetetrahydrofolate dehydrogenase/methenyltetrahydrofolate cyclohydrolase FolD [Pseudomonadota bacterium]